MCLLCGELAKACNCPRALEASWHESPLEIIRKFHPEPEEHVEPDDETPDEDGGLEWGYPPEYDPYGKIAA